VRERGGDNFGDRLAGSHVAEETEAVFMPALHARERVFEDTANGDDEVALIETGAHKGAPHVPRAAEDLRVVSEAPSIPTHCHCPSCSWRYGKRGPTIHTSCFAGFPGPGGSQFIGSCSFDGGLLSGDGIVTSPFCSSD